MVSHEIHASMVLKIMTMKQSDILTLKFSSLQLLLNKTYDFHMNYSQTKKVQMTHIFLPLVDEAIKFLGKKKVNNETIAYTQTLFALISKVASNELPEETQDQLLTLSMGYLDNQEKYALTLNTQLILTQSQLFEVYQTKLLEKLSGHIEHLLRAFARSASSKDEFFGESFTRAILKASLSLVTFFAKFLNVTQLEQLLKSILVQDKSFESEVQNILNVVSNDGLKSIGLKQMFQAVFNTFDEIIAQNLSAQSLLSTIAIRFFKHLLKPVLMRMKKEFCSEAYGKICQFFKEVF